MKGFPRVRPRTRNSGFTLIELIAVIGVLGVVAIASIPALGTVGDTRRRALAAEIERQLLLARAHAAASGRPAGVRFDAASQTLTLVRILAPGAAPAEIPGVTGASDSGAVTPVASLFQGVAFGSLSTMPGGDSAVWFAPTGEPQVRTSAGALVGVFTAAATVTVTGGPTITVHPLTGMIER